MIKAKVNIENFLLLMMGIFSTFQLFSFAGINLFSFLMIFFICEELVRKRKLKADKKVLALTLAIITSTAGSLFLSSNWTSNIDEWKFNAIKSTFIFLILFLTYCYMKGISTEKIRIFFKGFYFSCCFQILWCYLQFITYKLIGRGLNEIVFNLKTENVFEQYVLTGLNTNGGVLVGIIIFVCLTRSSMLLRIASIFILFLSGTSTMCITGIAFVLLIAIHELKKKHISISKKNIFIVICIIICAIVVTLTNTDIFVKIRRTISTLVIRLISVHTRNWIEGSTYVHFRYYSSLLYILSRIGVLRSLIGFGFKNGGLPFVKFFNQFPNMVYGTESDPISLLYGIGILGVVIFYIIIISVAIKGKKMDKKYLLFEIIIVFAGVFYSVHMNWLILVQFLLLEMVNRKVKFEELCKSKGAI